MRLAICAASALILSGCSWLGIGGPRGGGYAMGAQYQNAQYNAQYQGGFAQSGFSQGGGCAAPMPVMTGCGPTGGFSQQPVFGAPQTVTGPYGTHAGVAGQVQDGMNLSPNARKPRMRAQFGMGFEKSTSGNLLDFGKSTVSNSSGAYDPTVFNESSVTGTPSDGATTITTYTAVIEETLHPDISFDDVHSTPFSIKGGLEYILSPSTTIFANTAYAYAEGESGGGVSVMGRLRRLETTQGYDPETLQPLGPAVMNSAFIPNRRLATYGYDFSDLHRLDLNVGARRYFMPLYESEYENNISPFVSGSVGVSHHNAVKVKTEQSQLYYGNAFETGSYNYYDVVTPANNTTLYEAQWVPSGELLGGVEWQVSGKSAIAVETGLRFEGARKYSNGAKGDMNIAVPLTIRGSYNF